MFIDYEDINELEAIELLDSIWDNFKMWTPMELIEFLSEKGSPWWEYGKGAGNIILDELMLEYYEQYVEIDDS